MTYYSHDRLNQSHTRFRTHSIHHRKRPCQAFWIQIRALGTDPSQLCRGECWSHPIKSLCAWANLFGTDCTARLLCCLEDATVTDRQAGSSQRIGCSPLLSTFSGKREPSAREHCRAPNFSTAGHRHWCSRNLPATRVSRLISFAFGRTSWSKFCRFFALRGLVSTRSGSSLATSLCQ